MFVEELKTSPGLDFLCSRASRASEFPFVLSRRKDNHSLMRCISILVRVADMALENLVPVDLPLLLALLI